MPTKWPGENGTARKGIFHSYLVREPGIMVKLKGELRESKYPGKPKYIYISVPDDDAEYALNVESECEQAFADAPKGVWLRCHAKGNRDTPPSVMFADDAGPVFGDSDLEPVPDAEVARAQPRPAQAATPPTPPKANGHGTPMNETMRRCWGDAVSLVKADFPEASDDAAVESASRIANTLFIQASR